MSALDLWDKAQSFLRDRRGAYNTTFRNPMGERVLEDLAKFCRAHESTGHADAAVAARLDGRREVWLRISHHLNLTPEQLWQLYK